MKHLLTDYDNVKVDIFYNYISSLKKEEGTAWAKSYKDTDYVNIFKKEAKKGLFIDGESVTLIQRFIKGKGNILSVNYDYHAYKNRVIQAYPESIFDFDIVYDGDEFSFEKESGKVSYTHKKNDPFNTKKEILGAYGIIKNRRGEFIEILTIEDINKMKQSSKMTFIWNTWFDRMVKKSIIKRICSSAFNDFVSDLEKEDNENYNPNYASLSEEISDAIKTATSKDELTKIYNDNIDKNIDRKALVKTITDKIKEL